MCECDCKLRLRIAATKSNAQNEAKKRKITANRRRQPKRKERKKKTSSLHVRTQTLLKSLPSLFKDFPAADLCTHITVPYHRLPWNCDIDGDAHYQHKFPNLYFRCFRYGVATRCHLICVQIVLSFIFPRYFFSLPSSQWMSHVCILFTFCFRFCFSFVSRAMWNKNCKYNRIDRIPFSCHIFVTGKKQTKKKIESAKHVLVTAVQRKDFNRTRLCELLASDDVDRDDGDSSWASRHYQCCSCGNTKSLHRWIIATLLTHCHDTTGERISLSTINVCHARIAPMKNKTKKRNFCIHRSGDGRRATWTALGSFECIGFSYFALFRFFIPFTSNIYAQMMF